MTSNEPLPMPNNTDIDACCHQVTRLTAHLEKAKISLPVDRYCYDCPFVPPNAFQLKQDGSHYVFINESDDR